MIKIAINGCGRIGKLLIRRLFDMGLGENLILINEPIGTTENLANLIEFDSVHGSWNKRVSAKKGRIRIDGYDIKVPNAPTISELKTDISNLDLLIDCSGVNRELNKINQYLQFGVQKILVSAPIKDKRILNIVYGVNHGLYDHTKHNIITAASCTTNCLAPIVKVLDEKVGIKHGSISTIHNLTNSQTILDKPSPSIRRSRSAFNSLVPTTTGSAAAIALIFPKLEGKLDGHAVRVPVMNASLTDCVFEMKSEVSPKQINAFFKSAAKKELNGILGYEERELVSADFVNNPLSSIVDGPSTMVVNETQLKIYAWYDNEWGYVCRMVDIVKLIEANYEI